MAGIRASPADGAGRHSSHCGFVKVASSLWLEGAATYDRAVSHATDWLMKAQPQTTDERVFQLFGLTWAGVNPANEIIKKGVRELLAEQRADGGWAQLPTLASDAYATGQALGALRQAGALAATDAAYK